MISDFLSKLKEEATLVQALAALATLALFGWGLFKGIIWLWNRLFRQPKPAQVEARVTFADEQTRLTMPEFLRMRKLLRDDIIAELDRADDEERRRLQTRIDDLTAQINDPEGAFEAERKRLADLEDKLVREGNELGAERLNSAVAKLRAGNTDEAEAIFSEIAAREAMAVQRAARAEFGLGEIAESQVEWRAAAQHYARAAELDPSYDTLLRAGALLLRAGQCEAALDIHKRLVGLTKQEFGQRDPKTGVALNNYAEALRANGRFSDAEPLCREALEITREMLGHRHPYAATSVNNLAGLLENTGRYDEAEPLYREALGTTREIMGDRHSSVAIRLNNLARLLRATGRHAEAEPLFREALEIGRETLGDRHPAVATRLNNLAGLLRATGRVTEAEPLYREALAIDRETYGDRHPDVASSLNNLAALLEATGRVAEAEPLYREALEITRDTLGDRHPDVAIRLNNLAGLLRATGRADEATPLYLEAITIFRAALGDDHPNTQTVARNTLDHLREHAPDHPDRAGLEAVFGTPDQP
ncbi:tetratricopeptide repeat protein [Roseinatronobacter sp.]|uniref:tetratricopeptide repeat protein n=1 Tax=Roseinatronobacter sp. TaxID=1945755 RepID=UPI0025D254F4|nr:tetratricopeptide repeat protein [Roseibaca sp.]